MILDELYHSYENVANQMVPGWKTINKNELCNMYIDADDYMKDGYFAAIMLNYWTKISSYYRKSKPYASAQDCYDWVIDAILQALSEHQWRNEGHQLFGDPNGPDKAINVITKCIRANYFQALNRDKRKIWLKTYSYDALEDINSLDFLLPKIEYDYTNYDVNFSKEDNLVIKFFKSKDYLKAFMLDLILYQGLDKAEDIAREIKILDDRYANYFSEKYKISQNVVMLAIGYETKPTKTVLQQKIDSSFKEIKRLLKGARERED